MFFFGFSFLALLALPVTANLTMMIVWGVPGSTKNADLHPNTTWEECVTMCLQMQPCILAYQSDNSTCMNFKVSSISSIKKTTSANGTVVAFKVESSSGECPVGTDAPTFNGAPAGGSLYVDYNKDYFPEWDYYTINLSGDTWKVNVKQNVSCQGPFQDLIVHSDGTGCCWKSVYSTNSLSFTYDDSVKLCAEQTVTLASLHYPEDYTAFIGVVQRLRQKVNNPNAYVRLDGIRTAACQKTPTDADCMTVKGFTFTGKPPVNFDNYPWVTNVGAQANTDNNCIVMVVNGNSTVKTDVQGCGSTSPLEATLLLCAGPAWIY